MPVLRPGTKLKHETFEIVRLLGRGGFGEVYLARQPRMDRDVAIKVLLPGVAENRSVLTLFEREARTAGSLLHPNILTVIDFDHDEDEDVYFLVLPYVAGGRTLQHRLDEGSIPVTETARLIEAIASALDAAHERGILHRDVKPANILLDERDRPLLADFGIAHLGTVSGGLSVGTHMGSPPYMAPERWQGKTAHPSSDQYALAAMAYQMLAGRTPFVGEPAALMYQHLDLDPPPLSSLLDDVSPAVDEVVRRGLAKAEAARYGSVGDFARALAAAIEAQRLTALATRYERGVALVRAGHLTQALEDFEAIQAEYPDFRNVAEQIRRVQADLAGGPAEWASPERPGLAPASGVEAHFAPEALEPPTRGVPEVWGETSDAHHAADEPAATPPVPGLETYSQPITPFYAGQPNEALVQFQPGNDPEPGNGDLAAQPPVAEAPIAWVTHPPADATPVESAFAERSPVASSTLNHEPGAEDPGKDLVVGLDAEAGVADVTTARNVAKRSDPRHSQGLSARRSPRLIALVAVPVLLIAGAIAAWASGSGSPPGPQPTARPAIVAPLSTATPSPTSLPPQCVAAEETIAAVDTALSQKRLMAARDLLGPLELCPGLDTSDQRDAVALLLAVQDTFERHDWDHMLDLARSRPTKADAKLVPSAETALYAMLIDAGRAALDLDAAAPARVLCAEAADLRPTESPAFRCLADAQPTPSALPTEVPTAIPTAAPTAVRPPTPPPTPRPAVAPPAAPVSTRLPATATRLGPAPVAPGAAPTSTRLPPVSDLLYLPVQS